MRQGESKIIQFKSREKRDIFSLTLERKEERGEPKRRDQVTFGTPFLSVVCWFQKQAPPLNALNVSSFSRAEHVKKHDYSHPSAFAARRSRRKEVIVSDGRKREEEDGYKCERGA